MANLNPGRGAFIASLDETYTLASSTANFLRQAGVVIFHRDPITGATKSYQVGRALNSLSNIEKFKTYQIDNKGLSTIVFPNRYAGFGQLPDLTAVGTSPSPSPTPNPPAGTGLVMGMNLSPLVDWQGSPTVDRMHNAREFVSVLNGTYGSGTLAKDANGFVTSLQANQSAQSPIVIEGAKSEIPTGTWTFLWEGDRQNSTVSLRNQTLTYSTAIGATSHRATFTYNGTTDIWLDITQINPSNYPKNFKLLHPGYENNPTAFSNPFLKRTTFKNLRLMDWLATNWDGPTSGNRTSNWSERTTLNSYSQHMNTGTSLEFIFRLCNQLQANPYLNIPAGANDDYINQFLTFIRDNLDSALTCYVEFSNEGWNGQFGGYTLAAQKAQELGLVPRNGSTNSWDYAWTYQAYIAVEIRKKADTIFGVNKNRIKVCVSGQVGSGNADQATRMLRWVHPTYGVEAGTIIDFLVLAPYFSGEINRAANYDTTRQMTNAQMFQSMRDSINIEIPQWLTNHKNLVALFPNMKIGLYEGSQHLTSSQAASGRTQAERDWIQAKFAELNSDPEMFNIITEYLNMLQTNLPGSIFWYFADTSADSVFGFWGSQQSYLAPLSQSPKRRALHAFMGDNLANLETTAW